MKVEIGANAENQSDRAGYKTSEENCSFCFLSSSPLLTTSFSHHSGSWGWGGGVEGWGVGGWGSGGYEGVGRRITFLPAPYQWQMSSL